MDTVLLVILFMVALALIVVILLQRSEEGALSGLTGGSGGSGFMTGRAKANFMTRFTAILVAIFFGLSLFMSYRSAVQSPDTAKVLKEIKKANSSIILDKDIDKSTTEVEKTNDPKAKIKAKIKAPAVPK